MRIRPATPEDAEAVADLYLESAAGHAAADPDSYRIPDRAAAASHFADPGWSTVYVADDGGVVVGMVEVRVGPDPPSHSMLRPRRTATAGIAVSPEQRRRGVGTALMRTAEAWARERGVEVMLLDMLRTNEPALAFYAELGYEEHGALLRRALDA